VRDPASTRRRLIVTADDLGLHEDINRGIHRAHTDGIVTSASVVACGQAFAHAAAIMHECPSLDVGVHLTLVDEQPLSHAADISTLVQANGRFLSSYKALTARLLAGMIRPEEIRRELRAQIERVMTAGRRPSHLDGHQHVHVLPVIWRITRELAHEYGIPWIRIPHFDSVFASRKGLLDPCFRLGLNVLGSLAARQAGEARRISTLGLHLSGRLGERRLMRLLASVRDGVSEVVTHPGVTTPALTSRYPWRYDWSTELAALTSPRVQSALRRYSIELMRFSACSPSALNGKGHPAGLSRPV
jgi:predicted glycoside hydrolase/deacetylase ChbG (UPF0249 family)